MEEPLGVNSGSEMEECLGVNSGRRVARVDCDQKSENVGHWCTTFVRTCCTSGLWSGRVRTGSLVYDFCVYNI